MPVIDPAAIGGILADLGISILSYAGIAVILYSIGGILIRTVSWTFDKMFISFIGKFYEYFEMLISGELLTDTIVQGMMNRVYLIIGVIIVFRLMMLLINYIMNPSEVMDEKLGVNALVKRIIIGMILIIFMPQIFQYAFRIQDAILNDNIIENVIMSEKDARLVKQYKEKHGMGKIIGMTVFQGFFSLDKNRVNDGAIINNYDQATNIERDYDLSVIDSAGSGLNSGILTMYGDDYAHDYFPILSTVVLGYVLYLMIKFCLDVVVRSFKLSVLQIIAPITIVEYMVNGDRNEVFKTWRKTVIASFAMLFIRVITLWFVAYVATLLQPGIGAGSESLLSTSDNLLKAIIVLGLLAFVMEFPKLMSEIFGLDLEQDSAVKNVLGKTMGAATAGLALGGAAVGALGKPMKSLTKTGLSGIGNVGSSLKSSIAGSKTFDKAKNSKLGQGLSNAKANVASKLSAAKSKVANSAVGRAASKVNNSETMKAVKRAGSAGITGMANTASKEHLGTSLKTGAAAIGGAVLASNALTKSALSGYQQASGEHSKDKQKFAQEAQNAVMSSKLDLQTTMDVAANIKANTGKTGIDLENAVIDAEIRTRNPNMQNTIVDMEGRINASSSQADVTRNIEASLSNAGVSKQTIDSIINTEVKQVYAQGGTVTSADAGRIVKEAHKRDLPSDVKENARQASSLLS